MAHSLAFSSSRNPHLRNPLQAQAIQLPYAKGRGVKKDKSCAATFYRKACQLGWTQARAKQEISS
jgi:TPR repeat protein